MFRGALRFGAVIQSPYAVEPPVVVRPFLGEPDRVRTIVVEEQQRGALAVTALRRRPERAGRVLFEKPSDRRPFFERDRAALDVLIGAPRDLDVAELEDRRQLRPGFGRDRDECRSHVSPVVGSAVGSSGSETFGSAGEISGSRMSAPAPSPAGASGGAPTIVRASSSVTIGAVGYSTRAAFALVMRSSRSSCERRNRIDVPRGNHASDHTSSKSARTGSRDVRKIC